MLSFKELHEGNKFSGNGIEISFKDKPSDTKDIVKLLNAYDTQTWAIDSYSQQKKAVADNKNTVKMLSQIGSGEMKFKSGPSKIERTIKF